MTAARLVAGDQIAERVRRFVEESADSRLV
jgi:hypothetical protein